MTRETQATILRMCITQMADSHASAAGDYATWVALRDTERAEKARRARSRCRTALDRLNRALANLAKEDR